MWRCLGPSGPGAGSDPDCALKRLARCDDFTTVVVAAMAAQMVWALQLTAITAICVRFGPQCIVAAAHPATGWRGFLFWNGHGTAPLRAKQIQAAEQRRRRCERREVAEPSGACNQLSAARPPLTQAGWRRACVGMGPAPAPTAQRVPHPGRCWHLHTGFGRRHPGLGPGSRARRARIGR